MNTFVICNNKEEVQSHMSCWGNATFELSIKDIFVRRACMISLI